MPCVVPSTDEVRLLLWLALTTEIVDKCPERYSMANDHKCSARCFNHAGYLPDNNNCDVKINVTMTYIIIINLTGCGCQKAQSVA